MYNRASFQVNLILADNQFRPLLEDLEDTFDGVRMNFTNANEHVPEAERNNRVIKERVRALYHRLPYPRLPLILIVTMVMEAARKANYFPPKGGISQYYSPRVILHRTPLHYLKQCVFSTGSAVLAHDEPRWEKL